MINWPVLQREQALEALEARSKAIEGERVRLDAIQIEQQPLPDYVEALFEYSLGQLCAEAEWVARTLAYMTTKPWLDSASAGVSPAAPAAMERAGGPSAT
jgi:hypothetical protein